MNTEHLFCDTPGCGRFGFGRHDDTEESIRPASQEIGAPVEADRTPKRSIAEIIGWQSVEPGGDPEADWGTPTVDDMLAWLRERGYLLDSLWWDEVGTGPDPLAGEYVIELSQPCFVDGWFPFGPTVHAAVEAAVRAVAEGADRG